MNPFTSAGWFWRAWRARSVTFAALFALSLLGVSALSGFRHVLRGLGAPWYVWLLVPFVVVALLARKEAEWIPDAAERRKWSFRIIVAAIALTVALAKLSSSREKAHSAESLPAGGRADLHGR